MNFKKRTSAQIEQSVIEKDFTGGYEFLPWIIYNEKIKGLAIIAFCVLSIILPMPFCLQGSFDEKFQIITAIVCGILSIFVCFLTKKQYSQMKKGVSS